MSQQNVATWTSKKGIEIPFVVELTATEQEIELAIAAWTRAIKKAGCKYPPLFSAWQVMEFFASLTPAA